MNTRYLSFVFSLSIFFSFCEELREAKGFCRDEGFDSSILKFNQKESLMICLSTVYLIVVTLSFFASELQENNIGKYKVMDDQ